MCIFVDMTTETHLQVLKRLNGRQYTRVLKEVNKRYGPDTSRTKAEYTLLVVEVAADLYPKADKK